MVNTVLAVHCGRREDGGGALPWIDPPSPTTDMPRHRHSSHARRQVKFAVCALRIVSAFGAGPSMKCGATFAVDVAGKPRYLDFPRGPPPFLLLVDREPDPGHRFGKTSPAGPCVRRQRTDSDAVPSLNDSVPARTFSLECGLSCRLTCATETGEGQPAGSTLLRAGSRSPTLEPDRVARRRCRRSTAFRPP